MLGHDDAPAGRENTKAVIGFLDLSRFREIFRTNSDEALAEGLDVFYRMTAEVVTRSGGRVIKYMGDGALLTWPIECADSALDAVLRLRDGTRAWAITRAWDTSLVVRLHAGNVIAGRFGPEGAGFDDVIGRAVAEAAMLPARTVSLSAEAFRLLSPEARQRLHKHSAPVVYIPVDDPRP